MKWYDTWDSFQNPGPGRVLGEVGGNRDEMALSWLLQLSEGQVKVHYAILPLFVIAFFYNKNKIVFLQIKQIENNTNKANTNHKKMAELTHSSYCEPLVSYQVR